MGTTGIIFGAIAVAWLIYLVPMFVRREDDVETEDTESLNRFADSIRIIRKGTAPLLDQDLAEIGSMQVSTPLTRRAATADLRRLESLAARRRLRMLVTLITLTSGLVSVCAFGVLPWWSVAIPAGLLIGFVVVARVSVRTMRRELDERYATIRRGSEENTVFLNVLSKLAVDDLTATLGAAETPIKSGPLWDPVPITLPTYVSKPLAPRTVRTIDLSSPSGIAHHDQLPITDDAPRPAAEPIASPQLGRDGRAASA